MKFSSPFATPTRDAPKAHASLSQGSEDTADDLDNINAQAILWHIRLLDGIPADGAAFETWRAVDPRHATAFASIHGGVILETDTAEQGDRARPHYARWGAGGAVAVALAAFVTAGMFRADPYEIMTPPGTRQIVTLDQTTRVTLNGGTRIRLDRRDARVATLLAGEALFEVRHDPARPFRLSVAGRQIEDVGTVFNVVTERDEVRVLVAEGSVVYNPAGERIRLKAGQGLIDGTTQHAIRIVDVPAADVGGWRRGQLIYAGQSLAVVAADLSRALGVKIIVSPAIAARPFSGAITVRSNGGERGAAEELARLTPALDLRIESTRDGWMMKPGNGAAQ